MSRPNQPRSIGAEDVVRRNLARLLEEHDRTTGWVERKIRERGGWMDVEPET